MTPKHYHKALEKLVSILDQGPPAEQIAKYLILMYQTLCEEWGSSCKQEILEKIVNDTAIMGLSKEQIRQLLALEDVK